MALLGRNQEREPLHFEETALFDKRDQLEKLEGVLLGDEPCNACFDLKGAGTGFLGITDRRLVIFDKQYLGKGKALVTLPFREIVTVAASDSDRMGRGFFGSSLLSVTARNGNEYSFEFRTSEKAHAAYSMILEHVL
jgi:hypothetical protein